MIAFEDAFPRLHAIRPYMPLAPNLASMSALSWADDEAIINFAVTVLERQKFAAARDLGWLEELASGDELKQRKGLGGNARDLRLISVRYPLPCWSDRAPAMSDSNQIDHCVPRW